MHRTKVKVVEEALDANNTIAARQPGGLRPRRRQGRQFHERPRAGKTTLLERVVADLPGVRVGVLEGDVQGSMDADRLASLHIPVIQLNTDPSFGGECHLDANMVRSAIPALPLDEIDLLIVENVGNLVCPAEFRIGEDARVMVCSVTEGEDKPLKYPLMFRTCELVLVNKIDLLPHLDFDLERLLYNIDQVHPDVERIARQRTHRRGHRRVARLAAADRRRARRSPHDGMRGRSLERGRAPADAARASAPRRTSASSTAEAERLARLCHLMAERFARGGRLIAFGRSPAARSDARHVAVEFVHPVIVGKRALPAIGLAGEGGDLGAQVELLARPDDIAIAFGTDEDGGEAAARARGRARPGCLTIAFSPRRRRARVRTAERRSLRPPGAGRDPLPPAVGARARVLRAPRPARRAATPAASTTPAPRASSIRSSASTSPSSSRSSTTSAARC